MISLYFTVMLPSANDVEKSNIKVKRKTKFQTMYHSSLKRFCVSKKECEKINRLFFGLQLLPVISCRIENTPLLS